MATETMQTFNYEVRDRNGKLVSGQLEADSAVTVSDRLRSMGYTPVSIEEASTSALQREITLPGLNRVKLKDLAVFSRQFATMISAGLSLIRALTILHEQTENKKLAEVIDEIRQDVEAGESLSDSMAKHTKVFPPLMVAMIRAGEASGMLSTVLLRIAEMIERDVNLRSTIRSAMTYPVVVFIMAIVLSAAMLIFIVPIFATMFDDLGGELPLMTRMLVTMSDFLMSWAGLLFFVILPIGVVTAFRMIRQSASGRMTLDRLKLRLPVFGPLFHKIAMSRFARNLATLLASGVPILQSLDITADTVGNSLIGEAVRDVQGAVRDGESMARPLTRHDVFPAMVVQMIAVGEETGNVDGMLNKVADFYDTEIQATTEALTSMMEPLMIGVIGGIVGGMVIALYLPMFQVFDLIE